jgi:hypothetical protein
MAESNLHSDFNRFDFERYQSGEMSYAEQYRFERRLQDEPAFADAYEGFLLSEKDKVDLGSVVGKLDRRLEERIAEKKTRLIPLWIYPVAAGLLISVGAGWLAFFSEKIVTPETQNETRVLKPETPSPKLEELVEEGIVLKREGSVKARSTINRKEKDLVDQSSELQFAVPVEEEVKIGGVESAQPLSSPAKGAAKYKKSPELLANRGTLEVTPISAPQAGAAKSALLASSVIKGKVLDEAGEGIPGVMIQDYRNQVVITDSVGNFSIHASEGDSLNLASVGYKRKDLLVGKDNFNAIVLEEDSKSLSEVVVLGYGVQRKRSVAGANVEKKEKEVPVPAQGLDAYTAYLKGKTRLTSQKGEVSVSFTVSADGSLSQFQAKGKKSLRDLAIQIIKEGPPWAPFKINGIGVERKVEVVVKFGE